VGTAVRVVRAVRVPVPGRGLVRGRVLADTKAVAMAVVVDFAVAAVAVAVAVVLRRPEPGLWTWTARA